MTNFPSDLKTIALHARNAEYNPKRFAAVIMRIREPKVKTLSSLPLVPAVSTSALSTDHHRPRL